MHPSWGGARSSEDRRLVTLGDWQHLGGLGDRGASSELAKDCGSPKRTRCAWSEPFHAGVGEKRLLGSAHRLGDMGGSITLGACHNMD